MAVIFSSESWRGALFRAQAPFRRTVRVTRGPAVFYVSTHDRVVGRHVYIHGEFEPAILRRAYAVLADLGQRPASGHMLVDVGANIGTSCIQALVEGLASAAVAIEPELGNLKLLRRNITANGLDDRISVIAAAVSDGVGTAALELSGDNSGDHRIHVGARGGRFGEDARPTVSVPVTTLDALCESGAMDLARTGLVSIDTQGHEAHVLAGAQMLRESDLPVVIELWPYGLARAGGLEDLEAILQQDYRWFIDLRSAACDRRPLSEITALRESIVEPYFTDLLLLKR